MVTIGMNYEVLEGKGEQFEAVFKSVLELMEGMEGHSASSLYADVFKPNTYLIVSAWSDEAAFKAFTTSEKFGKVVDWGKEKILVGRPHHEIYGGEESAPAPPAGKCPVAHDQAM
ncbi:MAG: antibiotic biosynthesis monooxygenase [Candidatus Hydrogenedentes bacterium]|nr:antibiotic biosynthesis monooxygenase [Candidatus Hydrogenedentota bacterium]